MRTRVALALSLVVIAVGLIVPVDPQTFHRKGVSAMNVLEVESLDLSAFSAEPPDRPLRLLFIHHSCGGQLLADPGPEQGVDCIYTSHPNGGGLRTLLEKNGYEVHEASYNSLLGQETDLFGWEPKFRDLMNEVLACKHQDERHDKGTSNDIVLFKSCYPNNAFIGQGMIPGDPQGPELNLRNAQAAYNALLGHFAENPEVLFVCVTAPPLAPKKKPMPLWKALARRVMGKDVDMEYQAGLARRFNNWLKARDGWLSEYHGSNVVVWDYYDLLTDHGRSNLSCYPSGDGYDSHPSQKGNEQAAQELLPLLNRAVRRAGLASN
ncbi:MAG: hypothetical protein KJ645_10915 [Planctomycetes bacterium]|nr:hypothetical protein [Planctomycetota bacterium]